MSRQIRVVRENTLYEVVPRVREGLPLPPTQTTNQLLAGILARTQRDEKVILCNFVDMNSHAHQHLIPTEPHKKIKFYMEYQKKVTDTVRKLTKLKRLELWEDRPSVFFMARLQDAIQRIVYLFLNPAKAGLVATIDDYPGLNTWHAFKTCEPSVDAEVTIEAHWTPVSVLEPLPTDNNNLSPAHDRAMAERLRETEGTMEYNLVIKPLAWLGVYGVTEPDQIEAIRQSIIKAVYDGEAAIAKERREKGLPVLGAERLKQQRYLRSHKPKKRERRIFVVCGDDIIRPQIISAQQDIYDRHRKCYQALKEGRPHDWPPGTFIPWVPPKACRAAYRPSIC